jgi:hypothetical protein
MHMKGGDSCGHPHTCTERIMGPAIYIGVPCASSLLLICCPCSLCLLFVAQLPCSWAVAPPQIAEQREPSSHSVHYISYIENILRTQCKTAKWRAAAAVHFSVLSRYRSWLKIASDPVRSGLPFRSKHVPDMLGDWRSSGREEEDAVIGP